LPAADDALGVAAKSKGTTMANQPHTKRDQGGQKEQGSGGGKGNPAKNSPGKGSQGGGSKGKNDSGGKK
jgi:hypothetical protein